MVVVMEARHPRSLDFANERKAMLLRDQGHTWDAVACRVRNISGLRPSVRLLKSLRSRLQARAHQKVYMYKNCGRKCWKATTDVQRFVLRRLVALRRCTICTSTVLQRELVAKKGVHLEASTIRKILKAHGHRWLPKAQKPKLTQEHMQQRLQFARKVLRMSRPALRATLDMALDGVVLSSPPKGDVERHNWCMHGDSHMYRKTGETACPELAGSDPYPDQIKKDRAVPMWGGTSEGGMAVVTFHPTKKLNTEAWVKVLDGGKLTRAIERIRPVRAHGPWTVLCDNESFLSTSASKEACSRQSISMWHVPPKSPDLNPVEKYWGWLRRALRQRDLHDLRAKRPALGKIAYKVRIRQICASQRSQQVARSFARNMRAVCQEVVLKKGARARC